VSCRVIVLDDRDLFGEETWTSVSEELSDEVAYQELMLKKDLCEENRSYRLSSP